MPDFFGLIRISADGCRRKPDGLRTEPDGKSLMLFPVRKTGNKKESPHASNSIVTAPSSSSASEKLQASTDAPPMP